MTTTAFVNVVTLTDAAWFNDADTLVYGGLTGIAGTNTITAAGPASMTAYAARQRFVFVPAGANTGATTINITPSGGSALGAKSIFFNGVALAGSELKSGIAATIVYNGTQFDLMNSSTAPVGTIPAGAMMDFAGTSAPAGGWLLCDGSAVSRTVYAALFAAVSTTWGIGDGSTTFNVPDFRRRTAVGSGGSGTGTLGNAVGNTGGEEGHALTAAENGPHTHNSIHGAFSGSGATLEFQGNASGNSSIQQTTDSSGSGTPHNTIQPSAIVLKIIKT